MVRGREKEGEWVEGKVGIAKATTEEEGEGRGRGQKKEEIKKDMVLDM